ncbi:MAG: hypothetical protein ACTTKN_10740 [Phocaeicola sp.]|uniref:hypothetical protein n=1 Tax=Phocaeicola TaxID=909656 RepID=UPI00234ED874|nr:hypothetical protein [Phocaeicola oris]MCE2616214.1 hypothetical protein [Phocaeicola oris]
MIVRRIFIFIAAVFLGIEVAHAQQTNAEEARNLFNSVYQMVFGEQGSTLHYDVNIIGIYKTNGTIWYKQKKMRYSEPRYASWNDGITAYMVDHKKRTVRIYRSDDDNKDTYLSKFKYNLNDYEYSWKNVDDGIEITLKPKRAGLIGIRQVKGVIDRETHYPLYLRIKVAFFWTTVRISNFRSGSIGDYNFIFPALQFKSYATTDHRNDKK